MKGAKPLTKTKGGKMFVSDSLDYQLDQGLDQMRWEYECAMYYEAKKEPPKDCQKEQNKRKWRLEKMIEKAIGKGSK